MKRLESLLRLLFAVVFVSPFAFCEATGLADRFGLVHAEPDFCAELGSGWTRHDITWEGIEREKGKFDFGEWPTRVDKFRARGVTVLPILDYNPAWDREVSPHDEQGFKEFANYVSKCVEQFKGKIKYWQVWNEPNLVFWKPEPNPRNYAELLRRSYLAAKAVDPDVQIIGFNCSDIDLEFTEEVIRYGGLNYCDILAYQPYRIAPEVGHFEEMAALRELVGRFGKQKPIWFTEMGWATQHLPLKEARGLDLLEPRPARRQAAFMVRYMVIIQATDVDKVFWFSQAADGAGLEDHARNTKRLGFYAYQFLMKTLDDYSSVTELVPHGAFGKYAYLFSCPKEDVVVAWSVNGPQKIDMQGLGQPTGARDVLGKAIETPSGRELQITGEPIYLFYDRVEARKEVALEVSPSRVWLQPGESARVAVTAKSIVGQEMIRDISVDEVDIVDGVDPVDGLRVSTRRSRPSVNGVALFDVSAKKNAKPSRHAVTVCAGTNSWTIEVNITPRIAWTYKGDSKGYLTPTELKQKDGTSQILLSAYDSTELACLSTNGERLWKYTEGTSINAPVVAADLDGDGHSEIVGAMPAKQTVLLLRGDGVLRWRTILPGEPPSGNPGWSWTRPEVADLDGDGRKEIVYADNHGLVTCLNSDGAAIWSTTVSQKRCDKPIFIGDVLGNGKNSILVSDEGGTLTCLANDGKPVWKVDTGAEIMAAPIAGALRDGEAPAIFVSNHDENLFRVSNDGKIVWTAPLGGTMDLGAGILLADLDKDGTKEIVASTRNHELLAFDADGKNLWRVETGAQIRSVPVIGDIDGDEEVEILIGSADWLLYCVSPKGKIEWTFNTGNRVDASPVVTNGFGGSKSDVVLPTRGGKVFALDMAGTH
jgi:hypothetical protein